jgi:hypothetical protein
MSEEMSRARRLAAILGLGLAAAGPALGAEHSFDGVYSGTRVLTKGSDLMCPAKENVSVTIHGQTLTFTNSALEKFTITFDPNRGGSFGELYGGGDIVKIHGRVIGEVIEADVTNYDTNPPCEHHWHLKKD